MVQALVKDLPITFFCTSEENSEFVVVVVAVLLNEFS